MYKWKNVGKKVQQRPTTENIDMAPKPEIIPYLELWQIGLDSKFQRQIRDFRWWRARWKISQMTATTIDYQKLWDWRPKSLYCYFRLSVVVAIARGQFLRARRDRKPQICRRNCHPIVQRYKYFRFWWPPYRYFRLSFDVTSGLDGHIAISSTVIRQCRIYLWTLCFSLAWSKTLFTALELL